MNKSVYRFLSLIAVFALTFAGYDRAIASSSLQIANTYYVSASGSDSNPGTQAAPFKTFAKATSVLIPGDMLQVVTGTYFETLNVSASGTAATPITVVGNNSVLNMQGINANGIAISGNYIRVSGFEITRATDFGILITGKYVTVERNNIHDNVTRNGVGTCGISTSWGSALKVKVGGENSIIRNNTVYNNCGEGIAVTRGVTTQVEGNTVYDNFRVNIYIDNSPYTTVQNNVSYCTGTHLYNGTRAEGISMGEEWYSNWGAQLHDIMVSGNTIRDCRYGVSAYESNVGGTLINVDISRNSVPSGETRSISLQTLSNQNVSVSNNTVFNEIYVLQPAGVTMSGNTVGGGASAPTFVDVPEDHVFRRYIEGFYSQGITTGCLATPLSYCPDAPVNRAAMAVFILRAKYGASHVPDPNQTHIFADLPIAGQEWMQSWIEEFYQEGITSGCGTSPLTYCPQGLVTREAMAVFLLRAKYGAGYTPPPASNPPLFADVPVAGREWMQPWIEEFYRQGYTTGCGTAPLRYCPGATVNRAAMAVFISRVFNIPQAP